MSNSERRKYPRADIQVKLHLSFSGTETAETLDATSVNVSMNGVYCEVNRYIPLFEKVRIMFVIPQKTKKDFNLISQCEAVVVRIEPEHEELRRNEYKIALYFQDLSQTERIMLRALLSSYN